MCPADRDQLSGGVGSQQPGLAMPAESICRLRTELSIRSDRSGILLPSCIILQLTSEWFGFVFVHPPGHYTDICEVEAGSDDSEVTLGARIQQSPLLHQALILQCSHHNSTTILDPKHSIKMARMVLSFEWGQQLYSCWISEQQQQQVLLYYEKLKDGAVILCLEIWRSN